MTGALQDAKNKFSSVANIVSSGEPQFVTQNVKPLVVVVSYSLYRDKVQPKRMPTSLFQYGSARTFSSFRRATMDVTTENAGVELCPTK